MARGLPDRIPWAQGVGGAKYSYTTSIESESKAVGGGQKWPWRSAFHPEFYKAGIADAGLPDHRMDKNGWNEQWMGWDRPRYSASSNVDNARIGSSENRCSSSAKRDTNVDRHRDDGSGSIRS